MVPETMDYPVALVTTSLPSGGRRWWFQCVASRNGGLPCGRRVSKLYLPTGGKVFACRRCYDLAHRSSRESRKWDSMFKVLAADTGLSFNVVKRDMMEDHLLCEEGRLMKSFRDIARTAEKLSKAAGKKTRCQRLES